MRPQKLFLGLVTCCAVALASSFSLGQEKKPDAKPPAGKTEGNQPPAGGMSKEEEAWMKAGMVGPEHKNLEYMIGTWDVTQKMWMNPDSEPMEAKGTSTNQWVLGGRFVRFDYKSDFMGMPFEGTGYTGYSNIDKKYVSHWMDNMSTGFYTSSGAYDAASKTFTFTGEQKEPLEGKMLKTRDTVKVVSMDEHIITFYHTEPGGKEQKVMELAYKRSGKTPTAAPAAPKTGH